VVLSGDLLGVLTAELRDASEGTHDSVRGLVQHVGGEVISLGGTTLKARPAATRSGGELLMRHVQADPLIIAESVSWS
jgi:hypothetical protein